MRTFKYIMLSAALFLVVSASNTMAAANTMAEDIAITVNSDPHFSRYYIQVDTFGGLAVLHGWVLTSKERTAIGQMVKRMNGVDRVYNYIVSDDMSDDIFCAMTDRDIRRTINKAERVEYAMANMNDGLRDFGTLIVTAESPLPETPEEFAYDRFHSPAIALPDTTAGAVKSNLVLDDITGLYNIRVDSYAGIVFLHGNVPNGQVAADADQIAARTPGVKQVVSYLNIESEGGRNVPAGPLEIALYHPDQRPRGRVQPAEPQYVKYKSNGYSGAR